MPTLCGPGCECDADWPTMPDGTEFDGKQLFTLVRNGESPFLDWDVDLLIQEIEKILETQVIDIPNVSRGSNNYGFHFTLSNRKDIVARLDRDDFNAAGYDGFPFERQVPEAKFEVAVYELLRSNTDILVSNLLYHRIPILHDGPKLHRPHDIAGRRLFVFEKAEGENNIWNDLDSQQNASLLAGAARVRASLFNFDLPSDFVAYWFLDRLYETKPKSLPIPVAPTREFCIALFMSKIKATIRNLGDMIGLKPYNEVVGPRAAATKQSLLRLIPHIMPADSDENSLYRLVLDHGDFGVHNMSVTMDANGQPIVTSLYDWETGCIVPAILSDPEMAVTVDLVTDEHADPAITRLGDDYTPDNYAEYMTWAKQYFQVLFDNAPDYKRAIQAGRDARHIWFALRDWKGLEDSEKYFGKLGAWAEVRIKELGID